MSCGFDACEGDTMGGYHVTPAGYAHMTRHLMGMADGKVVLALEGGKSSLTLCTLGVMGSLLSE